MLIRYDELNKVLFTIRNIFWSVVEFHSRLCVYVWWWWGGGRGEK